MAAGRVAIGFSKPYVADYVNNGGTISFANAQILARGVGVQIDPDTADDNIFYADNQAAESDTGTFTGGAITLTVDGLFTSAARFLYGLPAAGADGWTAYDDTANTGYKAVAYIAKYMSDGVVSYVPTVLVKCAFNQPGEELNTQEDEIDWQTQELSGRVLRGDDAAHTWKYVSEDGFATEAEAESALQTKLNYVEPTYHDVTQTLTNVTSTYLATKILDGTALNATLTANTGYEIDSVEVTMGGTDITTTAWDASTGKVSIAAATGDIVITATGTSL